jgi:transposase
MSGKRYTDEFKQEAVRQVTDRSYPVTEVAQRLGVTTHSLYAWLKYDFIQSHRREFRVRTMCRVLDVHPSGFYA